jgi:hypothetical protein
MNKQLLQNTINQLPLHEQIMFLEETLQNVKNRLFMQVESTDASKVQMIYKILQLNSEASVLHLVAEQLETNKRTEISESFENYRTLQKAKYKHLPILWGEGEPDINDFAGIWKDKDTTLETLREKAWKRNL